jgi:hypothetical protein
MRSLVTRKGALNMINLGEVQMEHRQEQVELAKHPANMVVNGNLGLEDRQNKCMENYIGSV